MRLVRLTSAFAVAMSLAFTAAACSDTDAPVSTRTVELRPPTTAAAFPGALGQATWESEGGERELEMSPELAGGDVVVVAVGADVVVGEDDRSLGSCATAGGNPCGRRELAQLGTAATEGWPRGNWRAAAPRGTPCRRQMASMRRVLSTTTSSARLYA